ncbi:hypothetical protein [Nonomuraea sp. CA-141351]
MGDLVLARDEVSESWPELSLISILFVHGLGYQLAGPKSADADTLE